MNNKFKIGDRVVTYSSQERVKGEVIKFIEPNYIEILSRDFPESDTMFFHVKQCRKLKPKPKLFECWVNEYDLMHGIPVRVHSQIYHNEKDATTDLHDGKEVKAIRTIHLREVRPKK